MELEERFLVLAISTGAFAPGVTMERATYRRDRAGGELLNDRPRCTSFVFGQFRNSYEYAPGIKWYPVGNHRVWLVGEGLRIVKSPVASITTPYNSGFTGWAPMLQWMFNF